MLEDSRHLRGRARAIIEDPANALHLSAASVWEIAIKIGSGRLDVPMRTESDFQRQLQLTNVAAVDITPAHAATAGALPRHHGDPFDRMIVAQGQILGVPVLTADPKLAAYEVETIMA